MQIWQVIQDNLGLLMTKMESEFTGLILLTGEDKPGIAYGLFQTLAQFAVRVIDIEQLVISNRLILTVLIALNPVHQSAVESDLASCADLLKVDIATLFTEGARTEHKADLVVIKIASQKLHPHTIELVSGALLKLAANIEAVQRSGSDPTSILITVSQVDPIVLGLAIDQLIFPDQSIITVVAP